MQSITVQIGSQDIEFKLCDTISNVTRILKDSEVILDPDPEIGRTNLTLVGDGIELAFKNDQLSTVFIYLQPEEPSIGRFHGPCNFLSDSFLSAPTAELFAKEMLALGLHKSDRPYPNSIDYLNDQIRIRFESKPGSAMILFDDGAFLRPPR